MQVLTLLNEKGGVGKTTLATHLAAGLAIEGQRVLLIDADGQANATQGLGVKPRPAFYNLLVRQESWESLIVYPAERNFAGERDVRGTLALLPGNVETRMVSEGTDDLGYLAERLSELDGAVDVVVIDTSPTPSLTHSMIYVASDGIVFPTELEYFSIMGVVNSIARRQKFSAARQQAGLKGIAVWGVVPTMQRDTLEHRELLAQLGAQFGDKVWPAVSSAIVWAEATRRQQTLYAYAPGSKAEAQAWALCKRLAGVLYASA